jgi:alpha-galactosidase
MRNIYLIAIAFTVVSCSLDNKNIRIRSGEISVEFDKNLNTRLQWLPAGPNSIINFDSAIQTGIIVNGTSCFKFNKDITKQTRRKVADKEYGPVLEAIITGICEEGDITIKRETQLLLPERFPGVALFRTTYQNMGNDPIHIDSIFSQRISLKNRTKEAGSQPQDFASFQGGINEWGSNYSLIWLTKVFRQENFQGMHHTTDTEIIGGGMPFVDIWSKTMGVAIAHLETKPQWLSLPVIVHPDGVAEASIVEKPSEKWGMKEWLNPEDNFKTVQSAVIFHHLDFYNALRTYSELLRCRGIDIMRTSPEKAYEPYWKSWGFGMDFTLEQIYNVLPELKEIGINIANLDDGWFDFYGDWNVNRSHGKFPGGEKDIIAFVEKIHKQGFKTNLWWYPLGVSPQSKLAKERPDLLVQAEDGSFPLDSRGLYQFCPAYEPAVKYIQYLVTRFTEKWGYDGLYSDTRGLAAVPPCYNKAHKHKSPLESFQEMPEVYKTIYETLQKHNKDAFQEVCICATPHSPYFMPYYQIASASDPVNQLQVRRRIKVEKAIHGPTFCVGDCYQVPKDEYTGFSSCQSFESAMGTGAQVTTFYKDLDSAQFQEWKKWVHKYRELNLGRAEYINLYDIAFDKPEIHVVKKGDSLFYGIYADTWDKKNAIQLRGLGKGVNYSVYDYRNDKQLEIINGNHPELHAEFKESLLLQLVPFK